MDESSYEEQLKAQKDNCIFCKIVKGEVPCKKVYEDERVLAFLDINPAVKGHVLVMPKEHYPLLPVIPFSEQQLLFKATHALMKAMKNALLCSSVTVFVANGAVAGQQSPHFLYHLLPREEGDNLPFSLQGGVSKEENDSLMPAVAQRITGFMNAYLEETGRKSVAAEQPQSAPVTHATEQVGSGGEQDGLERLISVINSNEDLKLAIIEQPEEVKRMIATDKKWEELFAGVDVDSLTENLKIMIAKNSKEQVDGGDN